MNAVHIHAYYCTHEWPAVVATDPVAVKWLAFFAAAKQEPSSSRTRTHP